MKKRNGFSLVELMIVVAIIALLTAIMTANFSSAKARSRDSKRISDISQIQLALAGFFDRCNFYPTALDITDSGGHCTSGTVNVNLGTFISKIPPPPTGGSVVAANYNYSAGSDATGVVDYVLGAQLEAANSNATSNALSAFPTTVGVTYTPTFTCDSTVNYCVGPK